MRLSVDGALLTAGWITALSEAHRPARRSVGLPHRRGRISDREPADLGPFPTPSDTPAYQDARRLVLEEALAVVTPMPSGWRLRL